MQSSSLETDQCEQNMNSLDDLKVSVIIKTYDNSENRGHDVTLHGENLKKCLLSTLDSLRRQTCPPYEIFIVDSSKGDGIAQLLQSYGAFPKGISLRRIPLTNEEFSHPRALNLGVAGAKGDIVVSLSGDATPGDRD